MWKNGLSILRLNLVLLPKNNPEDCKNYLKGKYINKGNNI
jgi:hypothetical protein